MKAIVFLILFQLIQTTLFAQNKSYSVWIITADSLYTVKNYTDAAKTYSTAFQSLGWRGYLNDRYNAACAWAQCNEIDSAFYQLTKIITKLNFKDYQKIKKERAFKKLHHDKRWKETTASVKKNMEHGLLIHNLPHVKKLDSIYFLDQEGRKNFEKMGNDKENYWQKIAIQDSLNLITVEAFLKEYGWLGVDEIGTEANSALFLVIQHSNLATQKKYFPLMKEAVKNGKASKTSLALLEDRILVGEGKPQIYGSQLTRNENGNWNFFEIEDEKNVNNRRTSIGLEPLENYAKYFGIEYHLPK